MYKKKVVFIGDTTWSIGGITNAVISRLDPEKYDCVSYDWSADMSAVEKLLTEGYKHVDVIFVPNIIKAEYDKFDFIHIDWNNPDLLRKIVAISHSNHIFEHDIWHDAYMSPWMHIAILGRENKKEFEKVYPDKNLELLYSGVDFNKFFNTRDISYIHTIGVNGVINSHPLWNTYKRPEILVEAAVRARVGLLFNSGYPISVGPEIYSRMDMYVCTSTVEAGPLGLLEAAACGLPVISTEVGYAKELDILKFETAEVCADIIKRFNAQGHGVIQAYTDYVYSQVKENFSYDMLVPTYWEPLINKIIDQNSDI